MKRSYKISTREKTLKESEETEPSEVCEEEEEPKGTRASNDAAAK